MPKMAIVLTPIQLILIHAMWLPMPEFQAVELGDVKRAFAKVNSDLHHKQPYPEEDTHRVRDLAGITTHFKQPYIIMVRRQKLLP
jgi:hypothetical protein